MSNERVRSIEQEQLLTVEERVAELQRYFGERTGVDLTGCGEAFTLTETECSSLYDLTPSEFSQRDRLGICVAAFAEIRDILKKEATENLRFFDQDPIVAKVFERCEQIAKRELSYRERRQSVREGAYVRV